jgi:Pentapeptide repeats (8 copies)
VAEQTKSGQGTTSSTTPQRPGPAWRSSLWLWPAVAIGLAGIAGALFGAVGALLVGGEALAALIVFAGILTLSSDGKLATALAAATVAALTVFVGLAWLKASHHSIDLPWVRGTASAPAPQASWTPPVNWQWQKVSQSMAQRANLRGADLNGATLAGLQLAYMDFDGVQANGASFRGSDLAFASFRGASLRDACLEGANLAGADIAGADFTGADVAGVKVSRHAKKTALVWPRKHARPAAACQ